MVNILVAGIALAIGYVAGAFTPAIDRKIKAYEVKKAAVVKADVKAEVAVVENDVKAEITNIEKKI